jgi:hypothetical protein
VRRRRAWLRAVSGFVAAFGVVALASPSAAQPPAGPSCSAWQECRTLALAAEDASAFELFHDLAWRVVQTGPKNDPSLLMLLARAQVLSNRPHDALVMLDRLASTGAADAALTDPAFASVRALSGWSDIEARIVARAAGATPAAAPRASSRAVTGAAASIPPAPVPAKPAVMPITVDSTEAARFPSAPFVIGGLAYDTVSDRLVIADRSARRLLVAPAHGTSAVDLVHGDAAGFHQITAMEIDGRRGDLWVASGEPGGASEMHRLQLLSGRLLRTYPVRGARATIVDVAVLESGAVLALDSAGRRLLEWRPGAAGFEPLMTVPFDGLTSLTITAPANASSVAYVAHGGGVSRVDLAAHAVTALSAPKGDSVRGREPVLSGIERLRFSGGALVAVRVNAAGARELVRLDLDRRGRAIERVTPIAASAPLGDAPALTASGDALFYLGPSTGADLVVYRIALR